MEMILRLALALALAGVVTTVVALHQRAKAIHGVGSKRLQDLRVVRVLTATDTEIAVLGNFVSDPKKKAAVVVVQAAALDPSGLQQLLQGLSLHEILVNDVYSTFRGDVSRDVPPYKVNVIYPATDKHVRKHMDQRFHMVVETKEAYHMITKPYIDNIPRESIEWVYNILDRCVPRAVSMVG
jgi:m7GpppX diphosphatase